MPSAWPTKTGNVIQAGQNTEHRCNDHETTECTDFQTSSLGDWNPFQGAHVDIFQIWAAKQGRRQDMKAVQFNVCVGTGNIKAIAISMVTGWIYPAKVGTARDQPSWKAGNDQRRWEWGDSTIILKGQAHELRGVEQSMPQGQVVGVAQRVSCSREMGWVKQVHSTYIETNTHTKLPQWGKGHLLETNPPTGSAGILPLPTQTHHRADYLSTQNSGIRVLTRKTIHISVFYKTLHTIQTQ